MKAAVNQMSSNFGESRPKKQFGKWVDLTPFQLWTDEHRISGTEFRSQANMDVGAPSQFHHNKQNLIDTFRKEGSA